MATWHNVSRKELCPICQKPDWCTVSNDGMMCVCKRVPSPHPAKSGQGWIHVLVERPRRDYIPLAPRRPQKRYFDASATMRGYWAEFTAPVPGQPHASHLALLADDLYLPADQVAKIRPGVSCHHNAWAFPMLDADGLCIGIRLREFGGSRKWSVAGSRDGLFFDPELQPREAIYNSIKGREIVIVEGATDVIAGYILGLPAVGRASCNTGTDHLRRLCDRLRVNRVSIVTDNDNYKGRPDGTPWRPGIEGAQRLAQQLGRPYRIITPAEKDLRDWYVAGLTAQTFWMVADLQPWRLK